MAKANEIMYPTDDSLSNEQLKATLLPEKRSAVGQHLEPDFAYIHKEIAKPISKLEPYTPCVVADTPTPFFEELSLSQALNFSKTPGKCH